MYRLIGAASGWGAQKRACEEGPKILQTYGLLEKLKKKGIAVSQWDLLLPSKLSQNEDISLSHALPIIYQFNTNLAKCVENVLKHKEFPVILGGDHSIAVGTWNGVYQYSQKKHKLPLGLIWIDAHMDAHTIKTTPSGAWHGMPLAGLLGYGDSKMAQLLQKEPVLFPEHLCLIGVRSYESGEAELLRSLNVRIFFIDEVKKKGMEVVMKEALAHVKRGAKHFGVSLDLDVIDPLEAPGVGTPEENGLSVEELLKGLSEVKKEQTLLAFELVEYNPQRNHHQQTAQLCYKILSTILQENHGQMD